MSDANLPTIHFFRSYRGNAIKSETTRRNRQTREDFFSNFPILNIQTLLTKAATSSSSSTSSMKPFTLPQIASTPRKEARVKRTLNAESPFIRYTQYHRPDLSNFDIHRTIPKPTNLNNPSLNIAKIPLIERERTFINIDDVDIQRYSPIPTRRQYNVVLPSLSGPDPEETS